ncbi:MAG: ABC transporter ATP-binding protein [Planctomycetota bacterium]|nr:ABC transporter ATP-binding protein [Planctomycetota bacterium]
MRTSSPLARLLRAMAPHRRQVWLASTCSVLNKVFDLAPPFLIALAIDVVIQRGDSFLAGWGIASPVGQLWLLAGLTLIVWGLESVFQYAYGLLWRGLAQTVQHELRLRAFAHVQRLDMAYFEDQSTGTLMSVLNDDVNQLERFLDDGATELLHVATTAIVITTTFFLLAPEVAWLAMLPVPFILWGSFVYQRRLEPRYAAVREQVGILNHQLANDLGGMATIKSFTTEDHETERLRVQSDVYRARNRHAIRMSAAFTPLIRMVIVVGFTATIVYGGIRVLDGALDAAPFALMAFLTQRLLWPLTRLGQTFDLYQRAMASTTRILDLLDLEPTIVDGPQGLPDPVRGEVLFDAVSFHYRAGYPVLRDLTLRMEAGKTTAVVGSTGSGKTTLVKLLLRFYDVTAGAIRVDGVDVRELPVRALRRRVGLVSQDVFLFHGTVRENIAYGRLGATHEEIVAAAQVAEAHAFIEALPEGYDTIVGERGQKLSGGQRQRISIARAVLKDPPILVLDEATSSVDNETEAAIQRSMERIAVGRTTIVIAHRLSTVRNAHEILVLDHGRLVERGRHDELVHQGGVYESLWRVQTGERSDAPRPA